MAMGMGLLLGVILVITILPSSAQPQPLPLPHVDGRDGMGKGACWGKIMQCVGNDQSRPFPSDVCCPVIEQQSKMKQRCFCSIAHDPNQAVRANGFLANCNLPSLSTICPNVPSPSPNASDASSSSPPHSVPSSSSTASLPPLGSAKPSASSSERSNIIVAIAVPSAIIVVLLLAICTRLYCRKANKKPVIANSQDGAAMEYVVLSKQNDRPLHPSQAPTYGVKTTDQSLHYELGTLMAATNHFSTDYRIGRGGFGIVYKGALENGQEIAVKRLEDSSGQGDKEFKTEVELLATLRHRNLVKLLGFCLASEEKLLVYEYVPNKSLDYFLFDPKKSGLLNWVKRYNIIRGIARGMLYLHQDSPTRIIHRDLKAANILLDMEMNPKISDFGMARISNFEQTHICTSRLAGTYGYMAPEYLMYGQMSVKSDVYSFGVLMLEIVSGKRISDTINDEYGVSENLLSFAWRCWEDGKQLEFMDCILRDSYSEDEVIRCIHQGLSCVQEDVNKRPTMGRIVHMLDSYSAAAGPPSMPQRPAFMSGGNADQSTTGSSSSSKPWSQTELNPR